MFFEFFVLNLQALRPTFYCHGIWLYQPSAKYLDAVLKGMPDILTQWPSVKVRVTEAGRCDSHFTKRHWYSVAERSPNYPCLAHRNIDLCKVIKFCLYKKHVRREKMYLENLRHTHTARKYVQISNGVLFWIPFPSWHRIVQHRHWKHCTF